MVVVLEIIGVFFVRFNLTFADLTPFLIAQFFSEKQFIRVCLGFEFNRSTI